MTPEALAELHALCFTQPRPWSSSEFTSLLGSDGVFLLAESQGFLLARVVADEAEILTLGVHPDARRQGIAARLMAIFRGEAISRGARTAFLEVAADNAAALALYAGAGFDRRGTRKAYYSRPGNQPVDAVVLSLTLG